MDCLDLILLMELAKNASVMAPTLPLVLPSFEWHVSMLAMELTVIAGQHEQVFAMARSSMVMGLPTAGLDGSQ